jgi:hypothetical protein
VNYRDLPLSCASSDGLWGALGLSVVSMWSSFMRESAGRRELLPDDPCRRSRAPSCTGVGHVYSCDPSLLRLMFGPRSD